MLDIFQLLTQDFLIRNDDVQIPAEAFFCYARWFILLTWFIFSSSIMLSG